MARAATTSDAFNAVAEPRRREILNFLALDAERPVGEIVEALGMEQPSVSKHLRVLLEVGLVNSRRKGRKAKVETEGEHERLRRARNGASNTHPTTAGSRSCSKRT